MPDPTMTPDRLNEMEALCETVSPAPWEAHVKPWEDELEIESPHDVPGMAYTEANASFITTARTALPELIAEVRRLTSDKDGAYSERDRMVQALSKLYPSYLARHPEDHKEWDDDWRWIVFVELPTGQASWHIHDSERGWFSHLDVRQNEWDGHTTEQKYERLMELDNLRSGGSAIERMGIAMRERNDALAERDALKEVLDENERLVDLLHRVALTEFIADDNGIVCLAHNEHPIAEEIERETHA